MQRKAVLLAGSENTLLDFPVVVKAGIRPALADAAHRRAVASLARITDLFMGRVNNASMIGMTPVAVPLAKNSCYALVGLPGICGQGWESEK